MNVHVIWLTFWVYMGCGPWLVTLHVDKYRHLDFPLFLMCQLEANKAIMSPDSKWSGNHPRDLVAPSYLLKHNSESVDWLVFPNPRSCRRGVMAHIAPINTVPPLGGKNTLSSSRDVLTVGNSALCKNTRTNNKHCVTRGDKRPFSSSHAPTDGKNTVRLSNFRVS